MDILKTIFAGLDVVFGKTSKKEREVFEDEEEMEEVKTERFTLEKLPDTPEAFAELPEASLDSPYKTVFMTLVLLLSCNKKSAYFHDMLQYLSGPRAVTKAESDLLITEAKSMKNVINSYFEGADAENGFKPKKPYTVTVSDGCDSYKKEGFVSLYVESSGDDEPRKVVARLSGDGKWYLWNQYLLEAIKETKEEEKEEVSEEAKEENKETEE